MKLARNCREKSIKNIVTHWKWKKKWLKLTIKKLTPWGVIKYSQKVLQFMGSSFRSVCSRGINVKIFHGDWESGTIFQY